MSIIHNLNTIQSQLPASCRLIAVTKTHTFPIIQATYDSGHRHFGENKVQELVPKYEALPKDIEWHLIGHLQSNKVKYISAFISLIHSVDSLKLLEEINKQGKKLGRIIPCLLQMHIATEETKFGFSESEVQEVLQLPQLKAFDHIQIEGLMGMATLTGDEAQIRKEFKGLKSFFEKLKTTPLPDNVKMKELSMGMSGDFQIAVEEGSTMVRVGSAIFGQRNYQQNA